VHGPNQASKEAASVDLNLQPRLVHHTSTMPSGNNLEIPAIKIYAELLRNIRAINIVITLEKGSKISPSARLSTERDILHVQHGAATQTLKLPSSSRSLPREYAASNLPLAKLAESSGSTFEELTVRIPLGPHQDEHEDEDEDYVPWNAEAISRSQGINCEQCGSSLLKTKRVSKWQDLPHDDWAEMMDLWHCHKPHEESKENENVGAAKGYSAANGGIVNVKAGLGYAGQAYILVSRDDCKHSIHVSLLSYQSFCLNKSEDFALHGRQRRRLAKEPLGFKNGMRFDTTVQDQLLSFLAYCLSKKPGFRTLGSETDGAQGKKLVFWPNAVCQDEHLEIDKEHLSNVVNAWKLF
jgi:HECT-like Ubiquitin-conjugating enzyme (E2)-binding